MGLGEELGLCDSVAATPDSILGKSREALQQVLHFFPADFQSGTDYRIVEAQNHLDWKKLSGPTMSPTLLSSPVNNYPKCCVCKLYFSSKFSLNSFSLIVFIFLPSGLLQTRLENQRNRAGSTTHSSLRMNEPFFQGSRNRALIITGSWLVCMKKDLLCI